jgi:hypothetical protein
MSKPFERTADSEVTDVVGKIVSEFASFDAKGTAFRYATDSTGSLPGLPEFDLDIANLKDIMEGVYTFITLADSWLHKSIKP